MTLTVKVAPGLADVDPAAWDALASHHNPFVEHAFLSALEDSGSVGPGTGWLPAHLLVEDADGALVGACPLYVKHDSYGEYIFDWGWAEGARRAGIPYYPKLVCAVPFTPATGPRLLAAPDAPPQIVAALIDGARALAERAEASSVHWLFVQEAERDLLAQRPDVHPRLTYQYHWENQGYASFDDFLATFRSKTRKEVRRERRAAADSGLALETRPGTELDEASWAALYPLYRRTIARKGAIPYLTEAFFALLPERLAHRVLVTTGRDDRGQVVAAALSFAKGDHVYGRYWGCRGRYASLHFELCYYRLIEHAIAHGLTRVEAGAQGAHKIRRGFLPSPTYSAHHIRHPGLAAAIAQYVRDEADAHEDDMAALAARSPHHRPG